MLLFSVITCYANINFKAANWLSQVKKVTLRTENLDYDAKIRIYNNAC